MRAHALVLAAPLTGYAKLALEVGNTVLESIGGYYEVVEFSWHGTRAVEG